MRHFGQILNHPGCFPCLPMRRRPLQSLDRSRGLSSAKESRPHRPSGPRWRAPCRRSSTHPATGWWLVRGARCTCVWKAGIRRGARAVCRSLFRGPRPPRPYRLLPPARVRSAFHFHSESRPVQPNTRCQFWRLNLVAGPWRRRAGRVGSQGRRRSCLLWSVPFA